MPKFGSGGNINVELRPPKLNAPPQGAQGVCTVRLATSGLLLWDTISSYIRSLNPSVEEWLCCCCAEEERRLPVTVNVVPGSPILVTLMMETLQFS
jgi:hypothetical protein